VSLSDSRCLDAVYMATIDNSVRAGVLQRRQKALDHEAANPIEIDALRAIGN
jgi:hypothetical protein